MAFLLKNTKPTGNIGGVEPVVNQRQRVRRATAALPQTTTRQIFRVHGGRVLVHLLMGTVTTVIEGTDPVIKVSSKALDAASVAIGTAVDVASTVDISSLEVGGMVVVEGDGTALVKSNAGAAYAAGGTSGGWVAPQGEIYVTAGASKTGAIQWEMWYQPLDPGAYVMPVDTATAAI